MKEDQKRWDERYLNRSYPTSPSLLLTEFRHKLKSGLALDIATGNGRNAAYLSKLGFQVEAVDISSIGFNQNISDKKNIHFIQQDLDHFHIKSSHYDLIINFNFLDRNLFTQIRNGLKINGLIVFETFLDNNKSLQANASNHYLCPGELLTEFKEFQIIHYTESKRKKKGDIIMNLASLVAQKIQN